MRLIRGCFAPGVNLHIDFNDRVLLRLRESSAELRVVTATVAVNVAAAVTATGTRKPNYCLRPAMNGEFLCACITYLELVWVPLEQKH